MRGARAVRKLEFLQMSELDDAGEAARGQQWTTGQRQHLEVAHRAKMLQPKVTNLGAPSEKESVERDHCGDVAHADVSDVDASKILK